MAMHPTIRLAPSLETGSRIHLLGRSARQRRKREREREKRGTERIAEDCEIERGPGHGLFASSALGESSELSRETPSVLGMPWWSIDKAMCNQVQPLNQTLDELHDASWRFKRINTMLTLDRHGLNAISQLTTPTNRQ